MPQPKDYKAIAAWGRFMCSYDYFVKNEQQKAAEDNAPLDAIYKREDGWHTLSEVTNRGTLAWFQENYPDLVPAEEKENENKH